MLALHSRIVFIASRPPQPHRAVIRMPVSRALANVSILPEQIKNIAQSQIRNVAPLRELCPRANLTEVTMEAKTETGSLISASKVNGTAVYNTGGESIGKIYDVMLDKVSGKVAYAVMSFGGFLGMGDSYHPLPWPLLKYDTGMGGYVVNLSKEKLQGAPNYATGAEPMWGDRAYDKKVYGYYNTPPFWGAV
jgi:hypothetical protein